MAKNDTPAASPGSGAAGAARRCGFVALIGAPNTGKSTLLNAFVGSKISIVTPKVQTTRSRITGIALNGPAQLIFVDTPGIFAPRRKLDRAMVAAAWAGAHNADIVVHLIDTSRARDDRVDEESERIIGGLRDSGREAVLALNKIDLVAKPALLALTRRLNEEGIYSEIFMISAFTGDGLDGLLAYLTDRVPPGPWLYPEDQIADIPLRLLAAEITREQIFLKLHKELPYAATVETESWEERDDGSARIDQVIYVQRPTQKAIVLGKGGHQIKDIGAAARAELETILERKVHLFLFVKVRATWPDDPARYREIGLEFPG